MVARARWAIQVSQDSVWDIQVRQKTFNDFAANLLIKTMYQILSDSPEFYGRYY